MKCYTETCTAEAVVRVRGMLGGDIFPHDYCLPCAARYQMVSQALGVMSLIEPLTIPPHPADEPA